MDNALNILLYNFLLQITDRFLEYPFYLKFDTDVHFYWPNQKNQYSRDKYC